MLAKLFSAIIGFFTVALLISNIAVAQTGTDGCYFDSCEDKEKPNLFIKDKFCADVQRALLDVPNNFKTLISEDYYYAYQGQSSPNGFYLKDRSFLGADVCYIASHDHRFLICEFIVPMDVKIEKVKTKVQTCANTLNFNYIEKEESDSKFMLCATESNLSLRAYRSPVKNHTIEFIISDNYYSCPKKSVF